jgi:hypothetical protein
MILDLSKPMSEESGESSGPDGQAGRWAAGESTTPVTSQGVESPGEPDCLACRVGDAGARRVSPGDPDGLADRWVGEVGIHHAGRLGRWQRCLTLAPSLRRALQSNVEANAKETDDDRWRQDKASREAVRSAVEEVVKATVRPKPIHGVCDVRLPEAKALHSRF